MWWTNYTVQLTLRIYYGDVATVGNEIITVFIVVFTLIFICHAVSRMRLVIHSVEFLHRRLCVVVRVIVDAAAVVVVMTDKRFWVRIRYVELLRQHTKCDSRSR